MKKLFLFVVVFMLISCGGSNNTMTRNGVKVDIREKLLDYNGFYLKEYFFTKIRKKGNSWDALSISFKVTPTSRQVNAKTMIDFDMIVFDYVTEHGIEYTYMNTIPLKEHILEKINADSNVISVIDVRTIRNYNDLIIVSIIFIVTLLSIFGLFLFLLIRWRK